MKEFLEIPVYEKDFPITFYHQEGHILTSPHWHKALEFYYVIEGVLTIGVENEIINISQGEIYIIDSGLIHYVLSSPGSERIVFLIEPHMFEERKNNDDILNNVSKIFQMINPHSKNWDRKTQKEMGSLMLRLHKELSSKNKGYKYMVRSIVYHMLVMIEREVPKEKTENLLTGKVNNQEIIDKLNIVYNYIEHHYHEDISLNKMANLVGYSPSYFSRFFKKHTNKTFMEFVNEFRINRAKWLLTTSSKQISDVAHASGFNSRKTFHHVFKENTKMSPLEYRDIMQKKSHDR